MAKLELISRVADGADARRVLIKLTREGERRLQKLSEIHLKELQAIGPDAGRNAEAVSAFLNAANRPRESYQWISAERFNASFSFSSEKSGAARDVEDRRFAATA